LSIVAVVGYHVFPEWVPGGFVGVDVFFVISGFLISTIIFESLRNSNFSFLEFYGHRIRRIFPALIVVIVSCLVLGWYILLPAEFKYLGNHVAASAAFVQNIVLSRETGYFDIASELKPLNHLWSLAIEEQFYAIFPLLMWGALRLRINLSALVALICGTSLAASILAVHYSAIASFFSLGTRAWELMAGALLASALLEAARRGSARSIGDYSEPSRSGPLRKLRSHLFRPWISRTPVFNSMVSIVGLALILYAVLAFDRTMPYPGVRAIAPVLGGVLLILSGPTAWVNGFVLSSRLAVFVGLISYPLYLWHWPLLSYVTIIDNASPEFYQRLSVALLSIVLAWITYRFVERPIRQNARRPNLTSGLVIAMILLMLLGVNAKHFYREYDQQADKILHAWNFAGYSGTAGMYLDGKYDFPAVGHNDNSKILFFGDSHAMQYRNVFPKLLAARASGQSRAPAEVLFPPFTDFPLDFPAKLLNDETIKTVVFSYFWALQYNSDQVDRAVRCCGNGLNGVIGRAGSSFTSQQMDELDHQWEATTKALRNAGKQVYFVLDNPFGRELAPQYLVRRSFFHRIEIAIVPFAKQQAIQRDEPVRSRIMTIARDTDSQIIDPIGHLCNEHICPALSSDGMPIYKDYDHLSEDAIVNHVHYFDVLMTSRAASDEVSSSSPANDNTHAIARQTQTSEGR